MSKEWNEAGEEEIFKGRELPTKVGAFYDPSKIKPLFEPLNKACESMDKAEKKGKEVFPGGATRNNDIYDIAWNLMPWDGIREIAKIFAEGSGSHGARNWENGQDPESTFNHLCDHLFRWWNGDRGGKENHLAKAGWGIVTLLAFEVRGMLDKDNTMHYKVDTK